MSCYFFWAWRVAPPCPATALIPLLHHAHPYSYPYPIPLLPSIPQVLRFKSYFVEEVPNSRLERERARIMTLSFHVSDNTLRVYEPPQESSGLYQVSVECWGGFFLVVQPSANIIVPLPPLTPLLSSPLLTLPPHLPQPRASLPSAMCP
jgi:hypothetical protein